MESRLSALGFAWADTTAAQVYTIHDLHPFLADEIVRRGAANLGTTPPLYQRHAGRRPKPEVDEEDEEELVRDRTPPPGQGVAEGGGRRR